MIYFLSLSFSLSLSGPGNFFVMIATEVGDYRQETDGRDEWFSCWRDLGLGTNKDGLGPKRDLSRQVNPDQSHSNVMKAEEDNTRVDDVCWDNTLQLQETTCGRNKFV